MLINILAVIGALSCVVFLLGLLLVIFCSEDTNESEVNNVPHNNLHA
jgi:hypothetical protein